MVVGNHNDSSIVKCKVEVCQCLTLTLRPTLPPTPTLTLTLRLSRLWAEVFHVTTSGSGTVKWQQVSEDLVPVNIACVGDTDPQLVFHITAYNSQVDKILDVRLVQPGMSQ